MARVFPKLRNAVLAGLGLVSAPIHAQTVTPASVSLRAAGTQQFSVSGLSNCLWRVDPPNGGFINLAGYYQAPLVIPFNLTANAICSNASGSGSASVNLIPSSIPVAGLNYIRGGNFAGATIPLSILAPLFAANGQIGMNGSTVKCASGCFGIVLSSNPDGTFSPSINTAVIATRDILQSGVCTYLKSTNGTAAYTASLAPQCKALAQYTEGATYTLWVDTDCSSSCTLAIDNLGVRNIKLADTTTDPNGALKAGVIAWVSYTPAIGNPGQFVWVLR